MIAYENDKGLRTPDFYISTAISSAGHRREPDLRAPAGIPEAIRRNNITGSLILRELVESPGSLLEADNVMAPTASARSRDGATSTTSASISPGCRG